MVQVAASKHNGTRLREKPQQIADELRTLIVNGELSEGESLGREPELVERFGVSRPSLREALRILEAEGLITVVRGVYGGVVVHHPDQRMTARTASLVLRARNVSLADVFEARALLEPLAARAIASKRSRRAAVAELAELIDKEESSIEDPESFGVANAEFHERLVSLGGNQTLGIITEMLDEVVVRAVAAVSKADDAIESLSTRRRGLRSQRRLLELIAAGDAGGAEEHWRAHMAVVGRVMLGQKASTVVELLHTYG
jgi:GntR family transcriptional regulator, transcriptional repressor for pyruvate dehydrogenase complex